MFVLLSWIYPPNCWLGVVRVELVDGQVHCVHSTSEMATPNALYNRKIGPSDKLLSMALWLRTLLVNDLPTPRRTPIARQQCALCDGDISRWDIMLLDSSILLRFLDSWMAPDTTSRISSGLRCTDMARSTARTRSFFIISSMAPSTTAWTCSTETCREIARSTANSRFFIDFWASSDVALSRLVSMLKLN